MDPSGCCYATQATITATSNVASTNEAASDMQSVIFNKISVLTQHNRANDRLK